MIAILIAASVAPLGAAAQSAQNEPPRCQGRVLGAAIGAAIGALVGRNIADEDRRGTGTGIGAGVGAAIGALIGREIDKNSPSCLPRGQERAGERERSGPGSLEI